MGSVFLPSRSLTPFIFLFLLLLLLAQWMPGVTLLKSSSLCLSKPCQNGAECRDDPSTFVCLCQSSSPTPSSLRCASSDDLCHPPICQGNATCQSTSPRPGELACWCNPGMSGRDCQSGAQICAQKLCDENAHCLSVAQRVAGYVCLCRPGYAGSLCEREANPCAPNPCHNGAICRIKGGMPACFCVPGFQGERCEIEVNECASKPCRNGATCVDEIGRYVCLCRPGYTGSICEVEIDECQSLPCLHGGSCFDHIDGFSCACPAGFQGDRCEIDVDDCTGHLCQNGAWCIDGINSYSCDCSQTGYTGLRCEIPVPPCSSQPCLNAALCQDEGRNYTCTCWPGFEGRHCELDVSECGSGPCLNGAICIERSWEAYYGTESLLPAYYDPRHAAGYVCRCRPGFTGALCEEDVDDCASFPCQNGASCQDAVDGYVCICSSESQDGILYGSPNCSEPLVGCQGHECQNEAACVPFLSQGLHGYRCSCPPGYTGSRCQTSTIFSFESADGFLSLQSLLVDVDVGVEATSNITLTFRTVLRDATLFKRGSEGVLLSLELLYGSLWLTFMKDDTSQALSLDQDVADGEWHTVQVLLEGGMLVLQLLESCGGDRCRTEAHVETGALVLQRTLIGGSTGGSTGTFIGCMRDLFVDSQLMVPEDWLSTSAINVTLGCADRQHCLDTPCENQGECVELRQGYRCLCPRPYKGHNCAEEYTPARFGQEDTSSYAVFTVTAQPPPSILSLSMFLRTRRESGLLLALSNATARYLHVWLERGRVRVQVDGVQSVTGQDVINDGEVHFVNIVVEGGRMTVSAPGNMSRSVMMVGQVRVGAGDEVYVGGTADEEESAAFGGYFKGCMQDLRLNEERLLFFPLSGAVGTNQPLRLVNVSEGCHGDDFCAKSPCQNGGMCFSEWDDFTCVCPASTSGRRCEEVAWCELRPCPPETHCRTVDQGYECFSNATFQNNITLMYLGNGLITRHLTSISFSIRTRKQNAVVLHANATSDFVTVSVQGGLLVLELRSTSSSSLPSSSSSPLSLRSTRPLADGEWHAVELLMAAPWANTSRWTMHLLNDADAPVTSDSEAGNLDFLREDVDIMLGGRDSDPAWNFIGCLGTFKIGGIALPYYGVADVRLPRTQKEQFQKTSGLILSGCAGGPVCNPDPCLNGGRCQDLFNLFNCTCPSGWTGQRCEINTDVCASGPCRHGNCTALGPRYECGCEFGYAGTDCEVEVDVCDQHRCANGGTCLRGLDKYACLCPENYTGPYCSQQVEEVPWYIVVRKVRPKLPVSICGNEKRNYTCFNGGNCSDTEFTCDCLPGFTGHRCEEEVDECRSNPCMNGGYCRNLVNKFHCVCELSYAGETCQIDLKAESPASELLLSVCLVSVVLFLALAAGTTALVVALNRRATRGTYSPSRQEKEGSRVEMWNIVQPPPAERLI